jgi:hypothetical protein
MAEPKIDDFGHVYFVLDMDEQTTVSDHAIGSRITKAQAMADIFELGVATLNGHPNDKQCTSCCCDEHGVSYGSVTVSLGLIAECPNIPMIVYQRICETLEVLGHQMVCMYCMALGNRKDNNVVERKDEGMGSGESVVPEQ